MRQLLAPIEITASAGYAGYPVQPGFSQLGALSAMAAFPWVRACIRARCDDVGGLPIVVVQGPDGVEQVPGHPFLRLLKRPSPGVTRTLLLRQLEADLSLTGNAYLWLRSVGINEWELHRLHPEQMRAEVRGGVIVRWIYGGEVRLSPLEVQHIHDVSWSDGLSALYGESAIRTLKDGLLTVQKSRAFAAAQAGKGRPDVIITYPSAQTVGPRALKEVVEQYLAAMASGVGVLALSGGPTVSSTSWTAKDVDFSGLDTAVRDETLSVLRVPPTRAGIPQANFAVAKAEMRDYWGSLVVSDLALIAEALTVIAQQVGGSASDEVRFDTSAVEALQTSYDQRQARAGFWVTVMGADPRAAASYEGFRDAPVGVPPSSRESSRPKPEVDDQPSRQSAALSAWYTAAVGRVATGEADDNQEQWRLAGALELAGDPDPVGSALAIAPVLLEAARQAAESGEPLTAGRAAQITRAALRIPQAPAAIPTAK